MVAALRCAAEEGPAAVAGGGGAVVHMLGGHRGPAHEAQVDSIGGNLGPQINKLTKILMKSNLKRSHVQTPFS